MSKNLEIKKQVVAEIKEKLEQAQSVVLYDYRGLTVEQVTKLRNECRKAGVEYVVYKNNLIGLAARSSVSKALTIISRARPPLLSA